MFATSRADLHVATSIEDALRALGDAGPDGVPLAGGTWLMRAPLRGEPAAGLYVALSRIPEMRRIEIGADSVTLGALATHMQVAESLASLPDCAGLVAAVTKAANPAVRHMATIGGNLSCAGFPASDIVPALLCLEAEVELRAGMQQEWLALAEFLSRRAALPTAALLTRIRFARQPLCCAHARLPLRRAGDYPVAIVSASARLAEDGRIDELRLAVGSVESVAKRWPRLEAFARGRRLDPEEMASAAELFREDFTGRDGVEAEGWYRIQVLPALVRRAARSLMQPI